MAHPHVLRHGAGAPVGGVPGRAVEGLRDNVLDGLLGVLPFATAARFVFEPLTAVRCKASAPLRDRVLASAQCRGDLVVRLPFSSEQQNTCANYIAYRRARRADRSLQDYALFNAERNNRCTTHLPLPISCDRREYNILCLIYVTIH